MNIAQVYSQSSSNVLVKLALNPYGQAYTKEQTDAFAIELKKVFPDANEIVVTNLNIETIIVSNKE